MMEIDLYTSEFCANGDQAGRLLERHGLAFTEHMIGEAEDFRRQLRAETGSVVAPQIVVGSRRIGGYEELHSWLRSFASEAEELQSA